MNKHITTASALAIAAILALGSTAAMSDTGYGAPKGGVLKLNKAPTHQQTEMVCENLAKSKNLAGSNRTSYLATCEKGG
ncbi:MAG TPA: hypothetical protein VMH34_03245 [Gammaproteobacteria bacterium]|nr:hypothetical protein [Gammaproteobacteria bacterium]